MKSRKYPVIESVISGSYADEAGLMKGDRLVSINGNPILDSIDLKFFESDELIKINYQSRNGKTGKIKLLKEYDDSVGIILEPFKVKRCKNRCIFCFVHQLPKGLRKTLYIKDEDYRLSFMHGNYVTFSALTDEELDRIIYQRLTPLYMSVHTTNNTLRGEMLGNPRARDVTGVIEKFADAGIKLHTQIVLCPGINDGHELKKTITDLASFFPSVVSLAIVPVGVTKFRSNRAEVKKVTPSFAKKVINMLTPYQNEFKRRLGSTFAYLSDEFYIISKTNLPRLKEYDDFPQWENGVGMIASFEKGKRKALNLAKWARRKARNKKLKFGVITGKLPSFWVKSFCKEASALLDINVCAKVIKNNFFGNDITVTGLLTGGDILSQVKEEYDVLLIPSVTVKEGERLFLDSISVDEISSGLNCKTVLFDSTPLGFIEKIIEIL